MENAVVDALESMMDEQNCCEVMTTADRLGCIKLKTKALEVASVKFLNLTSPNAFNQLNTGFMEELVVSKALIVRGEVDVLEATIKWLIVNGHCVNDGMLERYFGERDGAELRKCRASVLVPPTKEVIDKLLYHLILDQLNHFDLSAMARLSREAKLDGVASSCMERMLDERRPRLTPPISLKSRCTHPRNCPTFTFSSRVYGVH